jgi:ABC-type branched-subunit amino acid transport system substrate-binding protein
MFAVLFTVRKMFTRLMMLFTFVLLAACDDVYVSNPGGGQSGGTVRVALLVPHGAASEQEQKLARDLENAARMAVADLEGVEIDLRVYGTAGLPDKARIAAIKAMSEGADIIVGPLHAESANAVALAVDGRNINVLAFSNNATIAGGNLFILGQTFGNTANRLAQFATRQGKGRILTVYSQNLSGELGRQAIEQAVIANGGTLAGSVSYQLSQRSVFDAVAKVKAAAKANGADSIFMTANTAGALPLLSQMLPETPGLNKDTVQYIGLARWDTPPQTLELPGVQGGWFALPDPGRNNLFRSRFNAKYGAVPHALAGLAYDGIAAVGALAKSGGPGALGRAQLTQPAGFQGVNGIFRLRPDGTTERGLAVATIEDKRVVVISPAPRSFGGPGS